MCRKIPTLLIVGLAVVACARTAQADLIGEYKVGDGTDYWVTAEATIGGDTLTITLTNKATAAVTPDIVHALSGFYFDWSGDPLTLTSFTGGTGDLYNNPVAQGTTPPTYQLSLAQAGADLRYGWGFGQTTTGMYGLSAIGGYDPWKVNDGKAYYGAKLDGADYLIIGSQTVADGLGTLKPPPSDFLILDEATFMLLVPTGTPLSAISNPVFTFGTGPDIVTPLPGAVLLGFLGLGYAGMKLRKHA